MYYIITNTNGDHEIREISSLLSFNVNSVKSLVKDEQPKEQAIGEYFKKTEVYTYSIKLNQYIKDGQIQFAHGTTLYHYKDLNGKHNYLSASGYRGKGNIIWKLNLENSCGLITKSCYFVDIDQNGTIYSDSIVIHVVKNVPLLKESAFEIKNADNLTWYMNKFMEEKFKSHLPILKKYIEQAKIRMLDDQIKKYQKAIEAFNAIKNQTLAIKLGAVKVRI